MLTLTAEKIKEISLLLAGAPPATAARMLSMFERVKIKGSKAIPVEVLLSALRDAGTADVVSKAMGIARLPSFSRLFWMPFESLFENGDIENLLPGSLARSSLNDVWQLISTRFASERIAELEPFATSAILRGDMQQAYAYVTELRADLLDNLCGFGNATIAQHATNPAFKATLLRLKPLLTAEAAGRDIWTHAMGQNGELSDQGVVELSGLVRHFENQDPDAARELLLLTMVNLPRPHQALRVLNKVSLGVDDRKLDMTEFAIVGRRALGIATREATKIETAFNAKTFDGKELASIVDRYNQCLHGLERECLLAKDGPWKQEVVSIRSRIGNRLEVLCQRASQALDMALPLQKSQRPNLTWSYDPRLDQHIDSEKVDMAICHLQFVESSRLFAPLAGFGAPRQNAYKHAITHVDLVRDALLAALKTPIAPNFVSDWIIATRTIIGAVEGVEAAEIFDRRCAAAAASRKAA